MKIISVTVLQNFIAIQPADINISVETEDKEPLIERHINNRYLFTFLCNDT